ncbi:MAG: T9SS C-terminal target domain-containing protein, partial [Bacteroidia bacterium]|nr:T9SS C-terminal target domain-containing protein [Bacteroidia bacterium]
MKNLSTIKSKLLVLSVMTLTLLSACKKDENNDNTTPGNVVNFTTTVLSDGTIQVEGSTNQNYTFDNTKKYLLKGFVYVDEGGTLTVQSGTVIKGDKITKGTLIVKRGGKIQATGTAADPIIFTSAEAVGSRNPGDWGGIIICGKAPINLPGGEGQIEGGPDALYG